MCSRRALMGVEAAAGKVRKRAGGRETTIWTGSVGLDMVGVAGWAVGRFLLGLLGRRRRSFFGGVLMKCGCVRGLCHGDFFWFAVSGAQDTSLDFNASPQVVLS
mmetsp:Transcript_55452/g.135997  ORF Transcript_55452/g.135997 Transcript_55452/m.135997 type:complete len:104 (+) Transcript_55452:446-757(+)